MSLEEMIDHLREQVEACDQYGSPFTARLVERFVDDLEAGGPVAELIGDWPGSPRADAVAVRLAGALHTAALSARDRALAAEYPAQRPDFQMDALWPIARGFLAREKSWVSTFIESPPQTNEVRRSIALLAGFLEIAQRHERDLETLELGASAGLNLHWDEFRYRTGSWSWGKANGPAEHVLIDTRWEGPPPALDARVHVRARAACDQNPLDLGDSEQRLRLRSYIWADQRERLARFDAAVELARARGTRVERADAADWVARKLAERTPGRTCVVYHSVFFQYPPSATRKAIVQAIKSAGDAATEDSPLAWLRLEPEAVLDRVPGSQRFLVDVTTWPSGHRRVVGVTDGHARSVSTLAKGVGDR